MMYRHGQGAALAQSAEAGAIPGFWSGTGVPRTADRKLTHRQFVAAYLALFLVRAGDDGTKVASLARFGAYEVRLIEFIEQTLVDTPVVWMELFAHDTRSSLDSVRCDDLDEAVATAEEFVARARELRQNQLRRP
jgi:hypothetical protein